MLSWLLPLFLLWCGGSSRPGQANHESGWQIQTSTEVGLINSKYRYHHIGIPARKKVAGEIHLKHLKVYATDHESNEFGIQWMRYEKDCDIPELVQKVAHVAFEVDDVYEAIKGKKVIIPPNSPSPGVLVAMIEEAGAPVELLQYTAKE